MRKINFLLIKSHLTFINVVNKVKTRNEGFGMNELLGIAAGIIIAAFIIVPGLKDLASGMMNRLQSWWVNIQNEFFPS